MKKLLPLLLLVSCSKTSEIKHQENRITAQQTELAAYLGLQIVQETPSPTQQFKHFKTKEEAKAWIDQVRMQGHFVNDKLVKMAQRENPEMPNDNTDNVPDADKNKDPSMNGGNNSAMQTPVSFTNIWGICGMNVSFTYGFDSDGNIRATGFAATLVGVYMFTGFDSKQYAYHVKNGTIYFTIMGFQTYGIMVEGFGLVLLKQSARINGSYNTKTGYHTSNYIAE